jgi:hypothetical protein
MRRITIGRVVVVMLVAAVVAGGVYVYRLASNPERPFFYHAESGAVDWWSSAMPGRPQRDRQWIRDHHAAILAEGRRACDWLSVRPDAPATDATGDSDLSSLEHRYLHHVRHAADHLAKATRYGVINAAWNDLCPDVRNIKTILPSDGAD